MPSTSPYYTNDTGSFTTVTNQSTNELSSSLNDNPTIGNNLNFSDRKRNYCLKAFISNEQLQQAREEIRKDKELVIICKPLKRKEDGKMPIKKDQLILKYKEWSG